MGGMKDLKRCLAEYAPVMLEAIAQAWRVEIKVGAEEEQMVEALASAMLSEEAVSRLLAELSTKERGALALVAESGVIQARRLTRRYGKVQRLGPAWLAEQKPWLAPATPAEHLWYLGLIYHGYGMIDSYHGEVYFVPPDLLGLLPPLEVPKPRFDLEPALPPTRQVSHELALARDVLAILSYARRANVRGSGGGYLSPQDVATLGGRLTRDDTGYLAFLQHLIQRAGLLRRAGKALKPSLQARAWLQAKPAERVRRLYDTWRDDGSWNELWHIPSLEPQDTGWRNDARQARQKVLGYLAHCQPGAWYGLDGMVRAIKAVDPDYLRPDGDYDSWYIRDVESKRYLTGYESWDRIEGALIAHIIMGPLFWLGAVRLGYADGTSTAFALTAWGAALLELPGATMPDLPERPLVVQSDFTVIAVREANLYDRYQLERFAEWTSEDAVTIYRITRHSVWPSLQEGVEIGQIRAFLHRASGGHVPQNVARTLQEWGTKFGQVRLARVVLLTTQDEQTMCEICASPLLKPYLGQAVSPRAVLADEAKIVDLVAVLERLGYWPRVEELD